MRTKLIVDSTEPGAAARTAMIADSPERLAALNHPEAWRILTDLARKPDYAGSLARRLRIHEQTVYYHIHRLAKAGVIRVVREERRQGAVGRVYAPSAEAFGVELPGPGRAKAPPRGAVPECVRAFLDTFSREGGTLVIGSPYQHGPFLTVARDSPFAVHLGLFLGGLMGPGARLGVRTDTDVKAGGREGGNLIVVGGPVANIVALDLNAHLRVTFDWQQAWRMRSSFTAREYTEEGVGLLAKIPSPWNPRAEVVMVSGLHHAGTEAAVLALTSFADRALRDWAPGREFYRVVQGLDRDGDGRTDAVEILE